MTLQKCVRCTWMGSLSETIGEWVFDSSWKNDPDYEPDGHCPYCQASTFSCTKCSVCDEWVDSSDLIGGICYDCRMDSLDTHIDNIEQLNKEIAK